MVAFPVVAAVKVKKCLLSGVIGPMYVIGALFVITYAIGQIYAMATIAVANATAAGRQLLTIRGGVTMKIL